MRVYRTRGLSVSIRILTIAAALCASLSAPVAAEDKGGNPTPTSSATPTPSPTPQCTDKAGNPIPCDTPTPTATPTATATPSPTPSATPTSSPSPSATATPSPTPSATPTPSSTPSPSLTPTPSPTPTPCTSPLLVPSEYGTIQSAIDAAVDGCEVIVSPGTYEEVLGFGGKNIIVRSTDPTSPTVVASTIVDALQSGSVVDFAGTETAACVLSGFTLTGGASSEGGGVHGGTGTAATIEYNDIRNNDSEVGGGLYNCDGAIRHNIVRNNSAVSYVGGILECDGAIVHNVIYGNTSLGMGECWGTIRNTVIWGNTGDPIDEAFNAVPSYCCIEGWTSGGTGNIASDPKFVDAANGDFHLASDSPCIDAGGTVAGATFDFDGDARSFDAWCAPGRGDGSDTDIGVDEVAQAQPIRVPANYATIQAAIDAAVDGCEIIVAPKTSTPKTYFENIHFHGKNIRLRAVGGGDMVNYAVAIDGGAAGPVVTFDGTETADCLLSGFLLINGSAPFGGGVFGNGTHATIQNCEIRGNHASVDGGGVFGVDGLLVNNTIAGNTAGGQGGGVAECDGALRNSIVWNNAATTNSMIFQSAEPSHCCIQGWTGGGEGNVFADPKFLDATGGDYRLRSGSPCVDAGAALGAPATDIEGAPRLDVVDIGADDYVYASCEPVTLVPGPYIDTDHDGYTDWYEVAMNTDPDPDSHPEYDPSRFPPLGNIDGVGSYPNGIDALLLYRYGARTLPLDPQPGIQLGDLNVDGCVDPQDGLILHKFVIGDIPAIPCPAPAIQFLYESMTISPDEGAATIPIILTAPVYGPVTAALQIDHANGSYGRDVVFGGSPVSLEATVVVPLDALHTDVTIAGADNGVAVGDPSSFVLNADYRFGVKAYLLKYSTASGAPDANVFDACVTVRPDAVPEDGEDPQRNASFKPRAFAMRLYYDPSVVEPYAATPPLIRGTSYFSLQFSGPHTDPLTPSHRYYEVAGTEARDLDETSGIDSASGLALFQVRWKYLAPGMSTGIRITPLCEDPEGCPLLTWNPDFVYPLGSGLSFPVEGATEPLGFGSGCGDSLPYDGLEVEINDCALRDPNPDMGGGALRYEVTGQTRCPTGVYLVPLNPDGEVLQNIQLHLKWDLPCGNHLCSSGYGTTWVPAKWSIWFPTGQYYDEGRCGRGSFEEDLLSPWFGINRTYSTHANYGGFPCADYVGGKLAEAKTGTHTFRRIVANRTRYPGVGNLIRAPYCTTRLETEISSADFPGDDPKSQIVVKYHETGTGKASIWRHDGSLLVGPEAPACNSTYHLYDAPPPPEEAARFAPQTITETDLWDHQVANAISYTMDVKIIEFGPIDLTFEVSAPTINTISNRYSYNLMGVDLDVDSNNTNDLLPSECDLCEDLIEQTSAWGKILPLNDEDSNGDGHVDFSINSTDTGSRFIPVQLVLPGTNWKTDEELWSEQLHVRFRLVATTDPYTPVTPSSNWGMLWPRDGSLPRISDDEISCSGGEILVTHLKPLQISETDTERKYQLYLEGRYLASGSPYLQVALGKRSGGEYWPAEYQDTVRLTPMTVDLDLGHRAAGVDTFPPDNLENAYAVPGSGGLYIPLNASDADADDIPDFADGYNRDPVETSDDVIDAGEDDLSFGVLRLNLVMDRPNSDILPYATVRFQYEASHPINDVQVSNDGSGPVYEVQGTGKFRIWNKSLAEPRTVANNYIEPASAGRVYTVAELCPAPDGDPSNTTLYLEMVNLGADNSHDTIRVEVDPDGPDGPCEYILWDTVWVAPEYDIVAVVESVTPWDKTPVEDTWITIAGSIRYRGEPLADSAIRLAFLDENGDIQEGPWDSGHSVALVGVASELTPPDELVERANENPNSFGTRMVFDGNLSNLPDTFPLEMRTSFLDGGTFIKGTFTETDGESRVFLNDDASEEGRIDIVSMETVSPTEIDEVAVIYSTDSFQVPFVLRETSEDSLEFVRVASRLAEYPRVTLPAGGLSDTEIDTITYDLLDADASVIETRSAIETGVDSLEFDCADRSVLLLGLAGSTESRFSAIIDVRAVPGKQRILLDSILETDLSTGVLHSSEAPGVHRNLVGADDIPSDPFRTTTDANGRFCARTRWDFASGGSMADYFHRRIVVLPDAMGTLPIDYLAQDSPDLFQIWEVPVDEGVTDSRMRTAHAAGGIIPSQSGTGLGGYVLDIMVSRPESWKIVLNTLVKTEIDYVPPIHDLHGLLRRNDRFAERDVRAMVLGLNFGAPNGAAASMTGQVEDIKFIVIDAPSKLFGFFVKDPKTAMELCVAANPALGFGGFSVIYQLDPEFRQKVNDFVQNGGLQLQNTKTVLFTAIDSFEKEWAGATQDEKLGILAAMYPNYAETLGAHVATEVMGWLLDPTSSVASRDYNSMAVGYIAGTIIGYVTAEVTVDVTATIVTGGAAAFKWVAKLGKAGRIGYLTKFLQVIHRIPLGKAENRMHQAHAIWGSFQVLDKVAPDDNVVRVCSYLGALPTAETAKRGAFLVDQAAAIPLREGQKAEELMDELTTAVGAIANRGNDMDAAAEAVVAVERLGWSNAADYWNGPPPDRWVNQLSGIGDGRGIDFSSANAIQESGEAIADLKVAEKSISAEIPVDPDNPIRLEEDILGYNKNNGDKLTGRGMDDATLVMRLRKLKYLSADGKKGYLKFIAHGGDAAKRSEQLAAAGKLLDLIDLNVTPPGNVADVERVFKNISKWSESTTGLTGTLEDGVRSTRLIIEHTNFGPHGTNGAQVLTDAFRILESDASPDFNGQAFFRTLGRNLEPDAPFGQRWLEDSLSAMNATPETGPLSSIVQANFGLPPPAVKEISGMREFQGLRCMDYARLSDGQQTAMRRVRDAIDSSDPIAPDEVFQKVVDEATFNNFIGGAHYTSIRKSVSRKKHVADLGTPEALIEGLRLDYLDSSFIDPNGNPVGLVYIIETPKPATSPIGPSYRLADGGLVPPPGDIHPFTGNGLISNRTGKISPEYYANTPIEISDGAAIWEVTPSGKVKIKEWRFQDQEWKWCDPLP